MKFNVSDTAKYRLFIAIFPPDEYSDYFARVLKFYDKQKRNLRNLPVNQVHLTLKFIGANVGEESKDMILETLQKYATQYTKPKIEITGIKFGFTYQKDPRIIMADVAYNEELDNLTDEVHLVVRSLKRKDTIRWKEKNAKDFHISVSRLKDTATRSSGKEITKLTKLINIKNPEPFYPTEIFLMQSIIEPGNVSYRKIASIKL